MVVLILKVDERKLPRLSEKLPGIKKRGLNLTSQGMIAELSKNSPVDHGVLRQWFVYRQTDDDVEIRTPAAYAPFVNDGTGIYNGGSIIKPKKGKLLVFEPGKKWKGPVSKDGLVFLRWSRGQKGQKFVEKSIEATQRKILDYFKIAINEAL
jgi:hypothetical protein